MRWLVTPKHPPRDVYDSPIGRFYTSRKLARRGGRKFIDPDTLTYSELMARHHPSPGGKLLGSKVVNGVPPDMETCMRNLERAWGRNRKTGKP